MKSFALIIVMWALALLTIALLNREHQPINGGLPLVKSSAAQGDLAKQNTWLTPCPLTPQNIPRIRPEEQA